MKSKEKQYRHEGIKIKTGEVGKPRLPWWGEKRRGFSRPRPLLLSGLQIPPTGWPSGFGDPSYNAKKESREM